MPKILKSGLLFSLKFMLTSVKPSPGIKFEIYSLVYSVIFSEVLSKAPLMPSALAAVDIKKVRISNKIFTIIFQIILVGLAIKLLTL